MVLSFLPNTGKGWNRIVSGFLRLLALSLLAAVFSFTSLNAQTVAYVTNDAGTTVSVIDTSTNAVIATIPVGNFPAGVVFSPDGTRAYVANSGDGTISVIDTAINTVIGTISLPAGEFAGVLAITPDGKNLYVTNLLSSTSGINVIATATNTVTATISGVGGGGLAITPNGAFVYATRENPNGAGPLNQVQVISTATNTVVGLPIPVGNSPTVPAITPDGAFVYVPNFFDSTVSVIAAATNTVVGLPIPVGIRPFTVAITPDGAFAYVTNSGDSTVSVIATATNTVVGPPITVVNGPEGLAVTPDGAFVFVANFDDTTVSVIATATNTVVASVSVGVGPQIIAIANLSSPLSKFTAGDLDISEHKLSLDGDFTLGATSRDLDFRHQPLTLTVGNFSLTIPAGQIKQVGGQHHFVFHGSISGMKVDFDLKSEHGSRRAFDYSVQVDEVDMDATNPVTVTLKIGLKIGHNTGTTTACPNHCRDDD
ncbi:MAG TPA: YncE family protein [Candidatus Angelobacter sp.]|jgi:YVTN family beta-propeller protein|nr:YncE family protein [Candidatus Angelobacter sp.]